MTYTAHVIVVARADGSRLWWGGTTFGPVPWNAVRYRDRQHATIALSHLQQLSFDNPAWPQGNDALNAFVHTMQLDA